MPNKFLWILDNGHGKNTPGKRSPKLADGRQLMEYEFNRAIVKKIATMLTQLCSGVNGYFFISKSCQS